MLVKIIKNNQEYNWEAWDTLNIPIYGKTFKSKKEAKQNWKQFAMNNNIKKWRYENVCQRLWRVLWKKVR